MAQSARLRILMITAEYVPFAKVGGLADMTAGLAAWLARQGHHVRVALPDYGNRDQPAGPAWCARSEPLEEALPGLDIRRITSMAHFGTRMIYLGDERDAARFVLLAEAALADAAASGFHPDVIHVHDWHAAAAIVLPSPWQPAPPTLLTLHNIGYQGIFAVTALSQFGEHALPLPPCTPEAAEALRDPVAAEPRINFLAAGIARATALTTVSPGHAAEILTPEYGAGLDGLLRTRADALQGILNGVDYGFWSPERDRLIEMPFSAEEPGGKQLNRAALLEELGLVLEEGTPLLCMITRLTEQKGIDLLLEALPPLLADGGFSLVVLGQGEPRYAQALAELAMAHPVGLQLLLTHDERLAHRLLAGSDMLLMPSRYEPCGLTQLYAMRYGTIPVVRATGGLADSVHHFDPASGEGTGVVFRDYDAGGLQWGLHQALEWFAEPPLWRQLMANAMRTDFSWESQGPRYEALYRRLAGSLR